MLSNDPREPVVSRARMPDTKSPASAAQAPDDGEDWRPPLGDATPTIRGWRWMSRALFAALHMCCDMYAGSPQLPAETVHKLRLFLSGESH